MDHYRIVEGKRVTAPGQIAIGRRGADALKKRVDDTLRVNGIPYRIVGIYETGQGMEESGGVVVLEDAQTIAQKERKVSLFQVGLRKGGNADNVIERIQSLDKEVTVSTVSYTHLDVYKRQPLVFSFCSCNFKVLDVKILVNSFNWFITENTCT